MVIVPADSTLMVRFKGSSFAIHHVGSLSIRLCLAPPKWRLAHTPNRRALGPAYRGTSLTRNRAPLGNYSRPVHRVLGGS